MKLYEIIGNANKKVIIKTGRLLELKRFYLSMYRYYMVKLYDNLYIDDPTRLNTKQIIQNIVELNIKGMKNISGKIQLTPEQFQYAIYKNKGAGEEVECFLTLAYNAFLYRSYSQDIDNFYDANEFEGNTKQKVSMNLKMVGPLVIENEAYRFSCATTSCFVNSDTEVCEASLNGYVWETALKELEIPEEDWYKDGLFDKDLTHEEEVACANLIFEGKLELSGKYGDVLIKWLQSHKWSEKGMSMMRRGLYEYIFGAYSEEMYQSIYSIFSKINGDGYQVLAICNNSVFYTKPSTLIPMPIGYFTVESGYEDVQMYEGNALNGYTGEVYSLDYLKEEGIIYSGCPIKLNTGCRDKNLYYDIEQVDLQCDTWFHSTGVEWEFDTPETYEFSKYPEGSLEYKIYHIYKNAQYGGPVEYLQRPESIKAFEDAKKNIMKYIS